MKPISITEDDGIGFPRNPVFLVSISVELLGYGHYEPLHRVVQGRNTIY